MDSEGMRNTGHWVSSIPAFLLSYILIKVARTDRLDHRSDLIQHIHRLGNCLWYQNVSILDHLSSGPPGRGAVADAFEVNRGIPTSGAA